MPIKDARSRGSAWHRPAPALHAPRTQPHAQPRAARPVAALLAVVLAGVGAVARLIS